MPGHDDAVRGAAGIGPEPSALSRRSVLRKAAGASAAGIAAAALTGSAFPPAGTRAAAPGSGTQAAHDEGSEPVVVHVRNAATGELDVFRGTSQTRLHDRDLAARLMRVSS
jgi:hypothetical protein